MCQLSLAVSGVQSETLFWAMWGFFLSKCERVHQQFSIAQLRFGAIQGAKDADTAALDHLQNPAGTCEYAQQGRNSRLM